MAPFALQTQETVAAVGCPPELDSKILLLRISHTLVVGHRNQAGIQLGPPYWWPTFMVLERALWAVVGETSTILLSHGLFMLHYQLAPCCNSGGVV